MKLIFVAVALLFMSQISYASNELCHSVVLSDKTKNIEHVIKAFRNGLDDPNGDGIMLHGTTIHALFEGLEIDYMPTGSIRKNHLFFMPYISNTFRKEDLPKLQTYRNKKEALEAVNFYAQINSRVYLFTKELGLALSPHFIGDIEELFVGYPTYDRKSVIQTISEKSELSTLSITRAYLKAQNEINEFSNGVVFMISKKILDQHKLEIGDHDDVCVNFEHGLPLEYIIGIDALGDPEYKYLDKLADENESTNSK